ncbi:Uma2 family endonuclease [Nostoc sp.]
MVCIVSSLAEDLILKLDFSCRPGDIDKFNILCLSDLCNQINPSLVADGFLSLGVERRKAGKYRKSYVVWEENNIVPILALEIVSLTPGGEYDKKLDTYAKLGVLYYIIYNPEYWQRARHQPFEVYRLVDGSYQLQIGEPFWMPAIGLGIGRGQYVSGNIQRQVLYWYGPQGNRYQTPEEQLELAQKKLERYRQQFGDLPED